MRKVLFNADDFGLSDGINKGIIQAFKKGVVRSVSLMVTGESFIAAVELVKKNPSLKVGIHLSLVGGKSVLLRNDIPTLVDKDGFFRNGFYSFSLDYILNRIKLKDIEREIRAQFKRFLNTGLEINHVNSHQHIHIIPPIFDIVVRICEELNLNTYIRIPYEPLKFKGYLFIKRPIRFMQWIVVTSLIFLLKFKKRRKIDQREHFAFRGFFDAGNLTLDSVKNILDTVKEETEIVCHPGIVDRQMLYKYEKWRYRWKDELAVLINRDLIKLLSERGIEVI